MLFLEHNVTVTCQCICRTKLKENVLYKYQGFKIMYLTPTNLVSVFDLQQVSSLNADQL